jgi:transcriptional regulator with XRE-family HTH domain
MKKDSKRKKLAEEIGSRLKVMREALNISQERMAANFGVSRTTYTNNEVGNTFPGLHVLKVLGDSFDISMDWLICSRGSMLYGNRMEQKQETGPGSVLGEVKELLEHMEHIPLLRHEVLSFFYKFKLENRELVGAAMKGSKIEEEKGND